MNDNEQLARLLQAMGIGKGELTITRVEFSPEGRAFIAYGENGDAYGGNLNDRTISIQETEDRLRRDAESGALGNFFSIYEPVPEDELAEKRGLNTDWKDIFVA